MNSINIGPRLVTEIHRSRGKNDPFGGQYTRECYGFHSMEPDDTGTWNHQPFLSAADDIPENWDEYGRIPGSPCYKETGSDLHTPEVRETVVESLLENGFAPYAMKELPEGFRHFVIHNQAPMEWHGPLDRGEEEPTCRVRVWMKGEWPS